VIGERVVLAVAAPDVLVGTADFGEPDVFAGTVGDAVPTPAPLAAAVTDEVAVVTDEVAVVAGAVVGAVLGLRVRRVVNTVGAGGAVTSGCGAGGVSAIVGSGAPVIGGAAPVGTVVGVGAVVGGAVAVITAMGGLETIVVAVDASVVGGSVDAGALWVGGVVDGLATGAGFFGSC
jgi:hypothetical protein